MVLEPWVFLSIWRAYRRMRKQSDVQTTLTRLRKEYRKAIENEDQGKISRLKEVIHTLEWILEIQTNPTTEPRD